MIFIELNNLETVNALCNICTKYKDLFDVDISHGRQVVDGMSILGVASLLSKIVRITPLTNNDDKINEFYNELHKIGANRV